MDALSALLEQLKKAGTSKGQVLGFLHVFIGRTIKRKSDGEILSKGITWREMANHLKRLRWDPEAVRELGIDPETLPPRDRQRFWYSAIAQAKPDSPAARKAGDEFAERLAELGYDVSAAPGS
jgi:hypothetical protein